MICEICKKEFNSHSGFGVHLSHTHQISKEDYYDQYLKKSVDEGCCKTCGNETRLISLWDGYAPYCSIKCAANNSDFIQHREHTCIEKYGVKSTNQLNEIKQKKQFTYMQKYGVDNPFKADIVKQKSRQTCIEKYGTLYATQSEIVKNKTKNTCIERYGVSTPLKNDDVKEKIKQTLLLNYGVDNISKNEDIKIIKQQTCFSHYGVNYPIQNDEIKNKIENTCIEKYGVPTFIMTLDYKLSRPGNDSKPNRKFQELLIENNLFESKAKNREFAIKNRNFDFKINNILLEIDPTPTHNVNWNPYGGKPIDKFYHQEKSKLALENNFHCIHIFDWDDQQKIINQLLLPKERIFARKCVIKEINKNEAKQFINSNHLQGYVNDSIRIGLYYNNELVSVMTFGEPRYNKKFDYELIRYCSSKNVVGGVEKLFKYFLRTYNPKSIISYCDLSKFTGYTYLKLGFILKSSKIVPSKHWYSLETKKHITDNLLRQRGFDQLFGTNYGKGTSNKELMLNAGFLEIFDCGQATYIFENKLKHI